MQPKAAHQSVQRLTLYAPFAYIKKLIAYPSLRSLPSLVMPCLDRTRPAQLAYMGLHLHKYNFQGVQGHAVIMVLTSGIDPAALLLKVMTY